MEKPGEVIGALRLNRAPLQWLGCTSLGGKPHYSVGDAFSTCLQNIDVVAPIMVEVGAKVPVVDGVGGPCAPERGFFAQKYFGSWQRHWRGIEIVGSVEEGVG